MSIRTSNFCILLSAALLAFVCSILLLASANFALEEPISRALVPLAAVFAALFIWWGTGVYFPETRRRTFGWVVGISAAVVIVFILLSGLLYDVSWDGQTYHAEAIVHLATGWNPFQVASPDAVVFPTLMSFFTKGPWIYAAALYKFTGVYEQAKAFNLILILACWLLSLAMLSTFRGLSRPWLAILSALLAFNPVSIYQMLTFYVDGQLSSLLIMTVALLILVYRRPDRFLFATLAAVAILTINVKLSGTLYFAVIVGGYVLWHFIARKERRIELVLWLAGGCLLGSVFVGYSPYISQFTTNLLTRGDPLYPTNWQSLIVLDYNAPPNFIPMGRWERLFASLFSKSEASPKNSQYKIPFTVTASEVEAFDAPDARTGGFGPLFGGAFLLTLALFARLRWAHREQLKYVAVFLVLTGFVLLSGLLNSESWWARYAPQFWLVPWLIAFMGIAIIQRGRWRILVYALVLTLCLNNVLILAASTVSAVRGSAIVAQQLADLKAMSDANGPLLEQLNSFVGTRYRLERYGVRITEVDQLPCPADQQMQAASSQMLICVK